MTDRRSIRGTESPAAGCSRRRFLAAGVAAPAVALAGNSAGRGAGLPAAFQAAAGQSKAARRPAGKAPAMRLSCLPVSFFDAISKGQMPLAEWMDFAVELGLDGVECGPLLVKPLGPATPAEFRRLADARKLAVTNYTAYSDFSNPDADARKSEVAAMLVNIQTTLELGAPSLRALTGQQRPGMDQASAVRWVVDSIRQVAEAAQKAGVHVNVENHTKAFTWKDFDFGIKSEIYLKVMDGLKDAPVGVQFDVANPLVAGEETLPLFEKVRSRIGYVHLNDVKRPGVFEFVQVGTGIAPIPEVLKRLVAQHYTGWVSIEEASRTGKDGVRGAVRYARQAIRDAVNA